MKEYLLSEALKTARQKRASRDFERRRIEVVTHGKKPENGLLLITHPTIEDSKILRLAAPDVFAMVTADVLNKTPYEAINRLAAIIISGMVPVYKGDREKTAYTYQKGAEIITAGHLLSIAPTGKTTLSEKIPSPKNLEFGGIIKILRLSTQNNNYVTPVVSFVPQSAILKNGQIRKGTVTHLIYCEPVKVQKSILGEGRVPDDDLRQFAEKICRSWTNGLAQVKIT